MKLILFVILFLPIVAEAQNIIANPTFSQHSDCPNDFSQISLCESWYDVTSGTPDYYHSCDDTTVYHWFGVPNNVSGTQNSLSNAYVGIITFDSGDSYREYFGTDFSPLLIGKTYKVTVNVSLADTFGIASSGLGVFFYVDAKPDTTTFSNLVITPQIDYTSFGAIADKTDWVTLSKYFIADSAYTHLVIGNFKSGSEINLLQVSGMFTGNSYYYIDSVAVENTPPAGLNSISNNPNLIAYPNPANDELNVTGLTEQTTYRLLSVTGTCVLQGSLQQRRSSVSMQDIVPGVYVLELTGMNGARDMVRVVKE